MPEFVALNGEETKKVMLDIITKEIDKALSESDKFGPHITYPLIKIRYHIHMGAYPQMQIDGEVPVIATGEVTIGDTEAKVGEVEEVIIESSKVIDTPDQAREDAGLGIIKTVVGNQGVTVDVAEPVVIKPPLMPTKPKGK